MKKRAYKLIALDLDGTTLRSDKTLSDRNRMALEAAMAEGIHIVIASGRSHSSLPDSIRRVKGIEYAITSNGAAIYETATGRRIREALLNPESVDQILAAFPEYPMWEAFVDGVPYAWAPYVDNALAYGGTKTSAAYVKATRTPIEDMRSFIREHREHLDSLDILVADLETQRRFRKILAEQVKDIYVTSSVTQLIEISHKDAGKASGVRWLTGYLGISREETVAFGDAENDADMIREAGLGIAMANGSEELKATANRVAASNDEDGVGLAIFEILEEQRRGGSV